MATYDTARRWPLTWPDGWRRTDRIQRTRANFGKTVTIDGPLRSDNTRERRKAKGQLSSADATHRLENELDRLDATEAILSTNQKLRLDGTPRSDLSEPSDVGAAVYFKLKKKPMALACDKWDRLADNIAAIAQHIDALRRIDRYGVGSLEQAFAGYAALPADPTSNWWLVLDVSRTATMSQIDEAFRAKAKQAHPDRDGGSHFDMARLTEARSAAKQELEAMR